MESQDIFTTEQLNTIENKNPAKKLSSFNPLQANAKAKACKSKTLRNKYQPMKTVFCNVYIGCPIK
jgi:hypothetical protein